LKWSHRLKSFSTRSSNGFGLPFLYLILVSGPLLLSCTSKPALPRLEVSEKSWFFGNMPTNTIVRHDFWLYNRGTAPLDITEIRPDCECTTYELSKTQIPAGDSSRLKLLFDAKGMYYRIEKQVYIESTDTVNSPDTIDFAALVNLEHPRLRPTAAVFFWSSVIGNDSRPEQSMYLLNRGSQTEHVSLATTPSEYFVAQADKQRILPGDSAVVTLRMVDFPEQPEIITGSLSIDIENEPPERITLPIRVRYRP
jgi:hypothetical protein